MPFTFEQIHIEVARNATDDFNLFHDKNKWQRIQKNPFQGPIVLGFQLEALIERQIEIVRETQDEEKIIDQHGLRFSCYEFTFANAVAPGSRGTLDIKPSRLTSGDNVTLSNRVSIRSNGQVALIGYKKHTQLPAYLAEPKLPDPVSIEQAEDRSYIPRTSFFLKRKFMNASNAKNFLTGSLVEQEEYFDELENKVRFPELFPCSYISCALLERANREGHDFEKNPMVYTGHKICVDSYYSSKLKSNDPLNILVSPRNKPASLAPESGIRSFECYGLLPGGRLLFRAIIDLLPLSAIIDRGR